MKVFWEVRPSQKTYQNGRCQCTKVMPQFCVQFFHIKFIQVIGYRCLLPQIHVLHDVDGRRRRDSMSNHIGLLLLCLRLCDVSSVPCCVEISSC